MDFETNICHVLAGECMFQFYVSKSVSEYISKAVSNYISTSVSKYVSNLCYSGARLRINKAPFMI